VQSIAGVISNSAKIKDVIQSGAPSATSKPGFRQIMDSAMQTQLTQSQEATRIGRSDQPGSLMHSVTKMLHHLNMRNQEINGLLNRVLRNQKIPASDLLALQGMMLNFSREVTAVSKIVESLVSSIKSTIQTQV